MHISRQIILGVLINSMSHLSILTVLYPQILYSIVERKINTFTNLYKQEAQEALSRSPEKHV